MIACKTSTLWLASIVAAVSLGLTVWAATADTAGDTPTSKGATKDAGKASAERPTTVTTTGPVARKDFTEDLGGGVTLEMVWVKGGTFKMGSPPSEKGRGANEGPQTDVTVAGFWLGKCEVTQEQYERIMGKNPSEFKGPTLPVGEVTWVAAMEFCRKLSSASQTGRSYTLPTEAQWEYACRAGSTGRFCCGDSDQGLGEYAWYSRNADKSVHPVGRKKANSWGLHDMHGNAWEWCLSQHKPYPYRADDGRNDPSGSAPRVMRSGAAGYSPQLCRSAYRGMTKPPTFRGGYIGVRVACVPTAPRR